MIFCDSLNWLEEVGVEVESVTQLQLNTLQRREGRGGEREREREREKVVKPVSVGETIP